MHYLQVGNPLMATSPTRLGTEGINVETIRTAIKQAIHQVTGISAEAISDSTSYDEDLGLDSLSILEITVSVENRFRFQATDEELSSIRTVADTVNLVQRRLSMETA